MLPLVIQLGSIVVGKVVANQIVNLIKKDQVINRIQVSFYKNQVHTAEL